MKCVYTIPPDRRFIDALAEGLWQKSGSDPLKLADSLVLLPTRRACRQLRAAFLRLIEAKATLLPRMKPIGEIDDEELYFSFNETSLLDIPFAITPLRRQLLLTQLIKKKENNIPLDQAAHLAAALAKLLDQVQIEHCDFANLEKLVPDNLAEHWQQILKFLEILVAEWPTILAEEGCLDPADRRNRILEAQAEVWRTKPPNYPIIAAGSTGSMPATSTLLDVIAVIPGCAVILPGLDQELDEEAWQKIKETHPQYGMKQMLEKFKMQRADVKLWPVCEGKKISRRVRLLQEAMRPAEVTEAWRNLSPKDFPNAALSGLTRLELDHPQEEAQIIALLLRSALEVPGKTAALVTPDRLLAERVIVSLARWGIEANDTGGTSLATEPVGAFLLDILNAASPDATPIDHLSLLKHPLAACNLAPVECRARAREVEISLWRMQQVDHAKKTEISDWFDQIKFQLQPLTATWHKELPLCERLTAHIEIASEMATTDKETGAERLWTNEAGEAAALWLNDWQSAAHDFPLVRGEEYVRLFTGLMRLVTVRPNYGQHDRISILGPLEARLIQADLMVLGGLNEGVWPPEAEIDPWMSRPMKVKFGLPLPERRVGLSAHDFVQLASAPEAVLTRSKRSDNAPTVASRFLLQLETVLQALGYHDSKNDALAPQEPWQKWGRQVDQPQKIVPCSRPSPCPPISARPRQLSVTEIGVWRRNPYAIYAKHILHLHKLDAIEAVLSAADRGLIIHEALEMFLKSFPGELPADALQKLIKIGQSIFAAYKDWPQVDAFWWPRFKRVAAWFIEQERERRSAGITVLNTEASGHMDFKDGVFTLKGRADRIDKLADGSLAIIDYKTGVPPRAKEVLQGHEPQLPLLALIASKGGFKNIAPHQVTELAYWQLNGGALVARQQAITKDIPRLVLAAQTGLLELITAFAEATTPYEVMPKPQMRPRFDDYMHLARVAEWSSAGEAHD